MRCPECECEAWRNGFNGRSQQIFKCSACRKQFTETSGTEFARMRYSKEVIAYAMKLNKKYGLSCYMISKLMETRGVKVSHVTVYKWTKRFQAR